MKKLILLFALILVFGLTVTYSQTVEISIEDLQKFRQSAVDADSYKKQKDEAEKQAKKWEQSSNDWQNLYLKEKTRADEIQGKVIRECDASKADLGKANFELREQSKDDKRRLGELEFDVRKMRSERKWIFAAGFGTGFFGGFQTAKKFNF